MKKQHLISLIPSLLLISALVSCGGSSEEEKPAMEQDSQSSASSLAPEKDEMPEARETKNVIYTGTVQTVGTSIYQQGTHRLNLDNGKFILLESDSVDLNGYVGEKADVFGSVRPTVEEGAMIMRVEKISLLEPKESSSSETSSAESDELEEDDNAESSSAKAEEAQESSESSEEEAAETDSSEEAAASEASSIPEMRTAQQSDIDAMAKEDLAAARWTQEYCSSHIGFCIPVHKNWWFKSFGTTSSHLWHVEIAAREIQELGEGPIVIKLVAGAVNTADGTVKTDEFTSVGYKAWDDTRHFEVVADPSLAGAVEYITASLRSQE